VPAACRPSQVRKAARGEIWVLKDNEEDRSRLGRIIPRHVLKRVLEALPLPLNPASGLAPYGDPEGISPPGGYAQPKMARDLLGRGTTVGRAAVQGNGEGLRGGGGGGGPCWSVKLDG
jgi:hypothetical protein